MLTARIWAPSTAYYILNIPAVSLIMSKLPPLSRLTFQSNTSSSFPVSVLTPVYAFAYAVLPGVPVFAARNKAFVTSLEGFWSAPVSCGARQARLFGFAERRLHSFEEGHQYQVHAVSERRARAFRKREPRHPKLRAVRVQNRAFAVKHGECLRYIVQ